MPVRVGSSEGLGGSALDTTIAEGQVNQDRQQHEWNDGVHNGQFHWPRRVPEHEEHGFGRQENDHKDANKKWPPCRHEQKVEEERHEA